MNTLDVICGDGIEYNWKYGGMALSINGGMGYPTTHLGWGMQYRAKPLTILQHFWVLNDPLQ